MEDALKLMLDAADRAIKSYLGRELESASRTWFPPIDRLGTDYLVVPETPVTAITSIHMDPTGYYGKPAGSFAASTQLTDGTDFVLKIDADNGTDSDSGIIVKLPGISTGLFDPRIIRAEWPRWEGGLKVVYTGGYTAAAMPQSIVHAAVLLTQRLWRESKRGGPVEALSVPNESFVRAREELRHNSSLGRLLSPFKRIAA